MTIGELRYLRVRQDGDGQDVRLRAHANAPNTDFLEVHFDANVSNSYPGSGTTLTDLSGEAHHATLNNGVGFDSTYGALTFNGSNQNVNTQALGISGDFVHTASLWVKPAVNQSALSATDWSAFFYIGEEPNTAATQAIAISYRKDELRYWFGANDVDVTTDFKANEWVHLAFVYRGGGGTAVNKDVYVNGVKQRYLRTDGSNYGDALNVQSTAFLRLGAAWGTNAAPYQDFNGSIANFRLFKRPLIEAEIHQLYDWEKVRFGRVALGDVVAFRDGSLGVGVAEPSRDDRLVVDGRVKADSMKTPSVVDRNDVVVYEQTGPHDRPLVKYPEVLSATVADGTAFGGYTATRSSNPGGAQYHVASAAYDGNDVTTWATSYHYNTTTGAAGSSITFEGENGDWNKLVMPTAIRLKHIYLKNTNNSAYSNGPRDIKLYGSNDGSTWTLIKAATDLPLANSSDFTTVDINATQYFNQYVFQMTKVYINSASAAYGRVGTLEYWGYEEGDVSTDSTWTSILNKPGTQHLEVYWDGADSNSYPGAGTEVFDLSGNGVKGVITGNDITFNDEYKAWTFGGTDTRTSNFQSPALASTFSGDQVHSVALWFKCDVVSGDTLFSITQPSDPWEDPEKVISVRFNNQIGGLRYLFWSNDTQYHGTDANITKDIWYHLCVTYSGGGGMTENKKLYLNGNEIHHTATSGSYFGNNLALPSGSVIRLGSRVEDTTRFFGSIANFRLFSKALSIEQVKELYAYDAVRFGHRASNSVSLHKGNLGVGVTAPTARLEVAGNERIQEYPPRVMTGHDTYMEGHGVFKARWANWYSGNTPTGMYNKLYAVAGQTNIWYGPYNGQVGGNGTAYNGGDIYSGTDFAASTTGEFFLDDVDGNRYHGAWTTLEMPYDILLQRIHLYQGANSEGISSRCITEDGVILGSANGHEWHHVHTFEGLQYGGTLGSYSFDAAGESVTVNATTPYKHYALVTTRTLHYAFTVIIGELIWFGTPAPTTLDDGHLTLGKALTTPRVSGHAAGAETPRAESLVVHYDTTVDSIKSGTKVVDTSGNGFNATLVGVTYSSSDRALHGDGISAGDYTTTPITISGGAMPFLSVCGLEPKSFLTGTSVSVLSFMGNKVNGQGFFLTYNQDRIWQDLYGKGVRFDVSLSLNRWYHVVTTYNGGSIQSGSSKMYLDGVEITSYTVQGTGGVSLPTSTNLELFDYINASNDRHQGDISNFKLWNVALTADEIAAEYALGRTGKALNITDTAVCLGGTAPRAQLDVRGTARFENITGGFPTYSRTTWAGVTSTTIPLDPDRFSVHKIFVRGKMTSPTGDSTRRCRIRPKTEGNTAFMSGSMESWS